MYIFFAYVSILVRVLVAIAGYVLGSLALYKIAKNHNIGHPWVAFIPLAHYYIIGVVCEEYIVCGVEIKRLDIVMPFLLLLRVALAASISWFAFVPAFIIGILMTLIMHKFFYMFDPSKALLLAIISLFGELTTALALFYIKDMRVSMSSAAYPYPFSGR